MASKASMIHPLTLSALFHSSSSLSWVLRMSTPSLQSQEHCITHVSITESAPGCGALSYLCLRRNVTGDRCDLYRKVSLIIHLRSWPISLHVSILLPSFSITVLIAIWYYHFMYLVISSHLLSSLSSTVVPSSMKHISFHCYCDILKA